MYDNNESNLLPLPICHLAQSRYITKGTSIYLGSLYHILSVHERLI